MTPVATNVHPRFGLYHDSVREADVTVDFEAVESHPGAHGHFAIDPIHTSQGWKITNTNVPNARETGGHEGLSIFVAELPDARFICDALNLAVGHVRDTDEGA